MKRKIIEWLINHSKTATDIIQYHRNEVVTFYEKMLDKMCKDDYERCQWKWVKGDNYCKAHVQCRGDYIIFDDVRFFTYCPYCGKRIGIL